VVEAQELSGIKAQHIFSDKVWCPAEAKVYTRQTLANLLNIAGESKDKKQQRK
jgi:hypothetical protein